MTESNAYSVLLSSLISVQYEKPIDTVEDLIATDRKIIVFPGTSTSSLLTTDPRKGVKQLAGKVTALPPGRKGMIMIVPR